MQRESGACKRCHRSRLCVKTIIPMTSLLIERLIDRETINLQYKCTKIHFGTWNEIPATCICVPASFAVQLPSMEGYKLKTCRCRSAVCSFLQRERLKTTAVETVWLVPPANTRERLPLNITSPYPGGKGTVHSAKQFSREA